MTSNPRRLWLFLSLGLILALLIPPGISVAQNGNPPTDGYYIVVQRGDTWNTIAARTGLSVAELRAANPRAIHPNAWLWVGEKIYVPGAEPSKTATPLARTATATAEPTEAVPTESPAAGTVVTETVTAEAPAATTATATPTGGGYWYTVKAGDTWYTVSRATGVSVLELWHANPEVNRPHQWLWVGDRVWVPGANAETAPTETPTPQATASATATAAATATATATSTSTPETEYSPTPTAASTSTVAPSPTEGLPASTATVSSTAAASATPVPAPASTPTPAPTATEPPAPTVNPTAAAAAAVAAGCPKDFASYPNAIGAYLNTKGRKVEDLEPWLRTCQVVRDNLGGVMQAAIQRADSVDLAVTIHDFSGDQGVPRGTFLVYFSSAKGYVLAGQADGSGKIDVLRIADVNADQKPDIVWTDTSCGAHSCFSTLFVYSWDGTAFRDWVDGEPTMADATYNFITTTVSGASGDSILAHGGVIASAGAGPQRGWTETYISPEGGPYRLYSQVYDKSTCLYYQIVDANKLFDNWVKDGFGPAIAAYQAAIQDPNATACGTIQDEVNVLRDFARLRLLIADVGSGKSAEATRSSSAIQTAAVASAAKAFLDSYTTSRSVVQACRDTTAYAQEHPETWQYLADWGYANPSFTADDLCPLAK